MRHLYSFGGFNYFCSRVPSYIPGKYSPRRPVHCPSAQQVQVDMKNSLASVGIRVHHQPETSLCDSSVPSDLCAYLEKMAYERMIQIVDITARLVGNALSAK